MFRIVYIALMVSCLALVAYGQAINTEFGKNRVQFHDDFNDWWQYETENFITYWYGKGRFIARPVIQMAEQEHDAIQSIFEHRMNDKIEVIVYVDISDLKQSNIGTEETFTNKTGETKIVGNKMFVYFDGNHKHLLDKVKTGISTVYFNNMMFGSNLQEIIQNAVLMNIPEWYRQGIIEYAAYGWDPDAENELRNLWDSNKKYHRFEKLAEQHPRIAGQSFWNYIALNYGRSNIANLLYLAKISRGTDNSFEYILNTSLENLKEEWAGFYTQYYGEEKGRFVLPPRSAELKLRSKGKIPVSNLKISPDGRSLVYVTNDKGKFRIVQRDLSTDRETILFKYGYKNLFQETDYNYPVIAWHPQKPEITFAYEHRDVIKLVKMNLESGEKMEQIIPTDFQRIYTISYINDLDYVFSASVDGFADLILYKSKNRNFEKITNDFYDDLDAEYTTIDGKKGILFSSNRLTDTIRELKYDTIIPTDAFDLWFLPEQSGVAQRLTFTPYVNETRPHLADQNFISFLSDKSGVKNMALLELKSGKSIHTTSVDRHIMFHDVSAASSRQVYSYYRDKSYHVVLEPLALKEVVPYHSQASFSPYDDKTGPIPLIIPDTMTAKPSVIEDGFLFQSEYEDGSDSGPLTSARPVVNKERFKFMGQPRPEISKKPAEPYINTRAIAANNKFALANVTTKMDNDLLFEGLESYTGDRQQLITTPMGFLFKANLRDLFEDHDVEGGFRIPTTFNGTEIFLVYTNKKKRTDRKMALYRKSNVYNNELDPTQTIPTRSKKTFLLGMYQLRYPFDIYRSVRATASMRFDRFLQLSTEPSSFNEPVANEKRVMLKLEYIFDNTHDASLNIKNGTRYKFYAEAINQFDLQFIDGFRFNASKGFTGILGFDARHYVPILGKSILALRLAGATSFGSQKMLYYVGGVENWLLPKFDNSVPLRDDGSFAYKVNAFHLRGFKNNIRNGSSFMVANTELRIPFMQYILGKNRGASFLRNLQLAGFYDAGLAWHGSGPFSEENPLNNIVISSPPLIELDIRYFRDPLVMGYGLGLRSQILGYFVKLDYARGIETRKVQKPVLYLSFGLDF